MSDLHRFAQELVAVSDGADRAAAAEVLQQTQALQETVPTEGTAVPVPVSALISDPVAAVASAGSPNVAPSSANDPAEATTHTNVPARTPDSRVVSGAGDSIELNAAAEARPVDKPTDSASPESHHHTAPAVSAATPTVTFTPPPSEHLHTLVPTPHPPTVTHTAAAHTVDEDVPMWIPSPPSPFVAQVTWAATQCAVLAPLFLLHSALLLAFAQVPLAFFHHLGAASSRRLLAYKLLAAAATLVAVALWWDQLTFWLYFGLFVGFVTLLFSL